jgi:hypothetical protein
MSMKGASMRKPSFSDRAIAAIVPLSLCCAALATQADVRPSPPASGAAPAPGGLVVVPQRDPAFGTGQKVRSAGEQAREFVRSQGLQTGFNADSRLFIGIGIYSFSLPADRPASVDGLRNDAFWIALLEAKSQIVGFMGKLVAATMERRVASSSTTGELGPATSSDDAYVSPAAYELLERLLKAEVDSRTAEGKSPGPTRDGLLRSVVMDERFEQAVRSVCKGEVAGAQAFRTFESVEPDGSAEVAVVLATNDTSRDLVRSLLRGTPAPRDIPAERIGAWAEQVGDMNLLYTHGAHVRTNEQGEVVLVAFGQSTPQNSNPRLKNVARSSADLNAALAARMFIGDLIESQAERQSLSSLKVFDDAREENRGKQEMLQQLKASAGPVTLEGGQSRHVWSVRHPRAEVDTHGCVWEFSLSGAKAAKELRQLMDDLAPSKGGPGARAVAPSAPPTARPGPAGSSGVGAPGQLLPRATKGGAGAPGRF